MKLILEIVPCKSVAEHLGLRIHQRETFRGWSVRLFLYPIYMKEKRADLLTIDTGRDQFNRSCLFWTLRPATNIELCEIWRFKYPSISFTTVSLSIVKPYSSI